MSRARELGDLTPLRELLASFRAWREGDSRTRPEGDPVVHALGIVCNRLEAAIGEAARPHLEMSVHELAKREGVSTSAIYKRARRGRALEIRNGKVRLSA